MSEDKLFELFVFFQWYFYDWGFPALPSNRTIGIHFQSINTFVNITQTDNTLDKRYVIFQTFQASFGFISLLAMLMNQDILVQIAFDPELNRLSHVYFK